MILLDKIIELNNVTFEYQNSDKHYEVLKDFSLSFERGSFNVILGHNGSGKSTLAKLLNGLIKPISGEVIVCGKSTNDEENDFFVKKSVPRVGRDARPRAGATMKKPPRRGGENGAKTRRFFDEISGGFGNEGST